MLSKMVYNVTVVTCCPSTRSFLPLPQLHLDLQHLHFAEKQVNKLHRAHMQLPEDFFCRTSFSLKMKAIWRLNMLPNVILSYLPSI